MENQKVDIFSCDIELVKEIIAAIEKHKGEVNPPTKMDNIPQYFFPLTVNK